MEIKLLKQHTHAGAVHQPGDVVDVDETIGRWLIEQKIGRAAPAQPQAFNLADEEEK